MNMDCLVALLKISNHKWSTSFGDLKGDRDKPARHDFKLPIHKLLRGFPNIKLFSKVIKQRY